MERLNGSIYALSTANISKVIGNTDRDTPISSVGIANLVAENETPQQPLQGFSRLVSSTMSCASRHLENSATPISDTTIRLLNSNVNDADLISELADKCDDISAIIDNLVEDELDDISDYWELLSEDSQFYYNQFGIISEILLNIDSNPTLLLNVGSKLSEKSLDFIRKVESILQVDRSTTNSQISLQDYEDYYENTNLNEKKLVIKEENKKYNSNKIKPQKIFRYTTTASSKKLIKIKDNNLTQPIPNKDLPNKALAILFDSELKSIFLSFISLGFDLNSIQPGSRTPWYPLAFRADEYQAIIDHDDMSLVDYKYTTTGKKNPSSKNRIRMFIKSTSDKKYDLNDKLISVPSSV
jgi:hypothetical protein